eukprot:jgi/Bigna1/137594/aug1.40_g12302
MALLLVGLQMQMKPEQQFTAHSSLVTYAQESLSALRVSPSISSKRIWSGMVQGAGRRLGGGGDDVLPTVMIIRRLRGGYEKNKDDEEWKKSVPIKIRQLPFAKEGQLMRPKWTKNKKANPQVGDRRKLIAERMKNHTERIYGRSFIGPDGQSYIPRGECIDLKSEMQRTNKTWRQLAMELFNENGELRLHPLKPKPFGEATYFLRHNAMRRFTRRRVKHHARSMAELKRPANQKRSSRKSARGT